MVVKELSIIRSVSTSAADIVIYDNNIMHIHIKIRNSFTMKDSIIIVEARTKLAQGNRYPVMYTAEYSFVTPSNEVTEFLSTAERRKLILADAFVVKSFSQRLAAKSYMLFKKPKTPTSIFASEEKAMIWLEKFV
tara:strand:+ start:91268 stop:91672 length:405 start_codon:yes stop_codon:yes gene_type:complete